MNSIATMYCCPSFLGAGVGPTGPTRQGPQVRAAWPASVASIRSGRSPFAGLDDPDETAVVQVDRRLVEPELLLLLCHAPGIFLGDASLEVRRVDGVKEVGGGHGLW